MNRLFSVVCAWKTMYIAQNRNYQLQRHLLYSAKLFRNCSVTTLWAGFQTYGKLCFDCGGAGGSNFGASRKTRRQTKRHSTDKFSPMLGLKCFQVRTIKDIFFLDRYEIHTQICSTIDRYGSIWKYSLHITSFPFHVCWLIFVDFIMHCLSFSDLTCFIQNEVFNIKKRN